VLLSPDGALLLAGGVSGALIGWRLDDGALACTFDGAGAAVSCACISGHEMLVGTQEGDVVGYALDPVVLYGRSVRDVAAWAYSPIERHPVRVRQLMTNHLTGGPPVSSTYEEQSSQRGRNNLASL